MIQAKTFIVQVLRPILLAYTFPSCYQSKYFCLMNHSYSLIILNLIILVYFTHLLYSHDKNQLISILLSLATITIGDKQPTPM